MERFLGSRLQPEIWKEVKNSSGVLLIGCEGGFSVLNTLPLYFSIKSLNKPVHLCNISLASLKSSTAPVIYYDEGISRAPVCFAVSASSEFAVSGTKPMEFFPEKYLCEWFQSKFQESISVFATERAGPHNLCESYKAICRVHGLDLIIVVDAGSDSLMAGDEQEIGGYLEDMLTIFAVNRSGIKAILCNIGIGCDRHLGVSDCSSLRAIAEITASGGFLGCFSLTKTMPEVGYYIDATEFVGERIPRKNIPGLQIVSADNGGFGNVEISEKQRAVIVNPIMAQYYFFKLEQVVKRIKYRDLVEEVKKAADLVTGIEYYREGLTERIREEIPLTSQF